MELKIIGTDGASKGSVELPAQFRETVNTDLIARAFLALQSTKKQPYGSFPEAGKRASARVSKRRRHYRGSYGHGISRIPRKVMGVRGTRFNWVGAFAPGTRGGRQAHPPKAEKIWVKKINDKEKKKAIRSALAAVVEKKVVALRGHRAPENYPFALDNSFEKLSKTKTVRETFEKIGLANEMERASIKKIRAGQGKLRGRRYVKKIGPLVVVGGDCQLLKSARNIAGFEAIRVDSINVEKLAPGAAPGRLVLFTEAALKTMAEKRLWSE